MRRWLIILLVLLMTIGLVTIVGCGSSGESSSTSDAGGDNMEGNDSSKVTLSSTEATACAGNRRTISSAAKSYQAMEGKAPSSIKQLVPGYLQSVPTCPSGGVYTLSGTEAKCSIHGS